MLIQVQIMFIIIAIHFIQVILIYKALIKIKISAKVYVKKTLFYKDNPVVHLNKMQGAVILHNYNISFSQ